MKITVDAIELFYRMFFSCYVDGKPSSENNKKIIKENLAKKIDLDFGEFCENLQEWDERRDAIIMVAEKLKKDVIDREVITMYFGGMEHTKVVLGDLAKEKIPVDSKFYRYTIFNHMLIPVCIKKVSIKERMIIGIYDNNDVKLSVVGMLFFQKDLQSMLEGKFVLCHYPMIVDPDPELQVVRSLLELQKKDDDFIEAAQSFAGKMSHADFPFLPILKKRIAQHEGS